MGRFVYHERHIAWLRAGFPLMSLEQLTDGFNRQFGLDKTVGQIRSTLKNHSIRCGRKQGELTRGDNRLLSKEQDAWLRENYRQLPLVEVVEALNAQFGLQLHIGQVRAYLKNHKITSGRTGRFEKWSEPWNKGTTGATGRNRTTFKKGNPPHNTKHLWHERINKDGYIEIKVSEPNPYTGYQSRYKFKHRWVWEQEHGPVPAGMIVSFIDGDKLNCALENLELISRAENAIRNKMSYSSLPEEIKPTAALLAKVYCKRHERKKEAARV